MNPLLHVPPASCVYLPAPLTIPGSMQVISREEEAFCSHHPSWLTPSLTSPSPGWPNPAKEATGKVAAPNLGASLLPRFGGLILGCLVPLLCSPASMATVSPLPGSTRFKPGRRNSSPTLFCLEASVSTLRPSAFSKALASGSW